MKKINVKGAIVSNSDKWIYELFDIDATCPKDITSVLENSKGEDVQLTINSPGGDVWSASEIYTELRSHNASVESRIVGIAASAASVIAMAGKVTMSPTAELMIHNAWTLAIGDRNDLGTVTDSLKVTDKAIASAYRNKTGLSEEELLSLMDKETWMGAEDAKEKGFIDEIMFENEATRIAASAHGILPKSVIDKMRTDALKEPTSISIDDIKDVVEEMKQGIINELNNNQSKPVKNNWLF